MAPLKVFNLMSRGRTTDKDLLVEMNQTFSEMTFILVVQRHSCRDNIKAIYFHTNHIFFGYELSPRWDECYVLSRTRQNQSWNTWNTTLRDLLFQFSGHAPKMENIWRHMVDAAGHGKCSRGMFGAELWMRTNFRGHDQTWDIPTSHQSTWCQMKQKKPCTWPFKGRGGTLQELLFEFDHLTTLILLTITYLD